MSNKIVVRYKKIEKKNKQKKIKFKNEYEMGFISVFIGEIHDGPLIYAEISGMI